MNKENGVELASWAIEGFQKGILTKEHLSDPEKLTALKALYKVYIHEGGHEVAINSVGWFVRSLRVGSAKYGVTEFIVNPLDSQEKVIPNLAMTCFAGKVAEDLSGYHDHKGCGSDIAKASSLSKIPGFGNNLSKGEQAAYSTLSGHMKDIKDTAWMRLSRDVRL